MKRTLKFMALASVSLMSFSDFAYAHSGSSDAASIQKVNNLISKMSLDEKFTLLTSYWAVGALGHSVPHGAIGSAGYTPGIKRLGIPALQATDAGLGVTNPADARKGDGATALPSGQAISGTFAPDLAFEAGRMIGTEAAHRGFNIVLGGGVNLVRDPRGGRNFEYAGEDPILAGEIAAAMVNGTQSMHVLSTVKHYAVNSMETGRNWLDSVIDEQSLRESDLLAFEIALKQAHPGSVMCGYNLVNGVHDCNDPYLLTDVLRKDWNYPGYVMSDWGGVYDGDAAFTAGLDQQSGLPIDGKAWFGRYMQDKVVAGAVPLSQVDEKVRHILYPIVAQGLMDAHTRPSETPADIMAHEKIAQRIEEAGAVLLKNEGAILPFGADVRRILVVGGNADKGVLVGGGSGAVLSRGGSPVAHREPANSPIMVWPRLFARGAPYNAIKPELPNARVTYLDGSDLNAVKAAAHAADRVVVFVTKWSVEARDNADLNLDPSQNKLIEAASSANPKTVVVLETGNPVAMPWRDNVRGIIEAWFPGSSGGRAIARILSGAVNPSGRLTVTWPTSEAQLPRPQIKGLGLDVEPGLETDPTRFTQKLDLTIEGANVGYRWFALKHQKPLYPFGFGLSYTAFAHKDLDIASEAEALKANITVTNVGARAGADILQIYVQLPDGSPERLAGYLRVDLAPGQTKRVRIPLSDYALARFDIKTKHWLRRAGRYKFRLAQDSQDHTGPTATLQLNQK